MDAEEFDLDAYLASLDERLLAIPEGRRILTRLDPLAFALLYCPHHLRGEETGNLITLSDFHLDLIEQAKQWIRPGIEPRQNRDAYIAPREAGKSTWLFLLLPLWAAAHQHMMFIAAFADSGPQAQQHLSSFRHELDTNELLRRDFPELCSPMRRPTGVTLADTQAMYFAKSGFVFGAKGVDASSLGMKVGNQRPRLLILDDIEPDEASYSAYQMGKRLGTIRDAIFPLNIRARVVISGTTTMPGSIIHQLIKSTMPGEVPEEWIAEEKIRIHHYKPIITRPDGSERSMWPEKWPMEFLNAIRHTRGFKKNYENDPAAGDGEYWTTDDIAHETLTGCTRSLLSIDPAVTTKTTSDFTGLAVVSWQPQRIAPDPRTGKPRIVEPSRCMVEHAEAVKLRGEPLRQKVLAILAAYPQIRLVVVEANQGGETWLDTLHDLPVKIRLTWSENPKEVRAAELLNWYQTRPRRVVHARPLPALEEQQTGFPRVQHDDLVDAVGAGVRKFLGRPESKPRSSAKQVSYV